MKKLLSVILSVIFIVAGTVTLTACNNKKSNKPVLTVYTESGFAPFEYLDEDGNVVGADIDLMKEICDIIGYTMVVKDVPFGSIFTNVQNDETAVGAAGITINEERLETGIFSFSFTTSTQYVIAPTGTFDAALQDGVLPLSALKGKKIGVQESTTGCWLVEDEIAGYDDETTGQHTPGALEDEASSCVEYKNAVIAAGYIGGQIDVVVIDELPAKSISASKTGLTTYKLDSEPESYAFYLNKNATELQSKINQALWVLVNGGMVDYFVNKHSGTYAVI
ncbi:MAG: transporter substrate-binding domain-containing protein [Clostridia bacterium]|nr:transporter substrate-binding domain-containing protein [Clostridia bacterium]